MTRTSREALTSYTDIVFRYDILDYITLWQSIPYYITLRYAMLHRRSQRRSDPTEVAQELSLPAELFQSLPGILCIYLYIYIYIYIYTHIIILIIINNSGPFIAPPTIYRAHSSSLVTPVVLLSYLVGRQLSDAEYVCVYVCMYVRTNVCTYVACMYVCMYVCHYVW